MELVLELALVSPVEKDLRAYLELVQELVLELDEELDGELEEEQELEELEQELELERNWLHFHSTTKEHNLFHLDKKFYF